MMREGVTMMLLRPLLVALHPGTPTLACFLHTPNKAPVYTHVYDTARACLWYDDHTPLLPPTSFTFTPRQTVPKSRRAASNPNCANQHLNAAAIKPPL